MSTEVRYAPYHPKWYRHRVSVGWWLQNAAYTQFMLRELTSVAVAYFGLIELWKFRAIRFGPDAYARFLSRMKSPMWFSLNSLAFLLVLFHAITWVNLTPKAVAVRFGGRRVPDAVIVGANYLAWLAISVCLAWLSQRG